MEWEIEQLHDKINQLNDEIAKKDTEIAELNEKYKYKCQNCAYSY